MVDHHTWELACALDCHLDEKEKSKLVEFSKRKKQGYKWVQPVTRSLKYSWILQIAKSISACFHWISQTNNQNGIVSKSVAWNIISCLHVLSVNPELLCSHSTLHSLISKQWFLYLDLETITTIRSIISIAHEGVFGVLKMQNN